MGGSGILATALGEELARRGHEVHFISYERPFRLPVDVPRLHFHPVVINDYDLFKYPDYTLPLSVKMAEVSHDHRLDVLHVHYAVPHATAAILAQSMLPPEEQPRVVTTLHGTDTTLLGRDPGYGPAIRHALTRSDAVTTVSTFLQRETQRLLAVDRPIDVIHNFFAPRSPRRSRKEVRRELGVQDEVLILHSSNLRPLKRIDLLLETVARIRPQDSFKLVILAGGDFTPFVKDIKRLGLEDPCRSTRQGQRHRRLLASRRPWVVHFRDGKLLPQHSGSDVFCLSQCRSMCRWYSRGGRRWREWTIGSRRRSRCALSRRREFD